MEVKEITQIYEINPYNDLPNGMEIFTVYRENLNRLIPCVGFSGEEHFFFIPGVTRFFLDYNPQEEIK